MPLIPVIISIAPVVGFSWPALAPLILLGAGSLGLKQVLDTQDNSETSMEIRRRLLQENSVSLPISEILSEAVLEEVRRGDALIFEKGQILLNVSRDERNRLRVTATGPKTIPKREIEAAGREFAREIAQLFAQSRIVDQLSRLNFDVVEDSVNEHKEIVLKVRRHTGD